MNVEKSNLKVKNVAIVSGYSQMEPKYHKTSLLAIGRENMIKIRSWVPGLLNGSGMTGLGGASRSRGSGALFTTGR